MRLSSLKLSAALVLALTRITPLMATDLNDFVLIDPDNAELVKTLVSYENSKNHLSNIALLYKCDTPLLEAFFHHTVHPTQEDAIKILRFIKQKELEWPGFTHVLKCLWNGTNPTEFNIPGLSIEQNNDLKLIASKLIDRQGNMRNTIELRPGRLNAIPRLLGACTDLTNIDISGLKLTNLSFLHNMVNLTKLKLHNNQLAHARGLENLKNLSHLDLSNNQLTDLRPLKTLTGLTKLDLSQNKITRTTGLENLRDLTNLDLSQNQVSDLSGLKPLTGLTELNLSKNNIEDLNPISNLIVKYLYISDNPIVESDDKRQEATNLLTKAEYKYM